MTIFRVQHNKNYTVINNTICTDKRLSWKAKGIWMYAFSRPDDWEFNVTDLSNQSTDGKDSVSSGLKELVATGYLRRERIRNKDGTLGDSEWTFFEVPNELKESLPKTENPLLENPNQENPPLLNTELKLNTEQQQQSQPKTRDASKKELAAADVVSFEELEELNIPRQEKDWLLKNRSIEAIQHAIKYAKVTPIKTSLVQVLKWASEALPDIPKKEEDILQENKSYAEQFRNKKSSFAIYEILHKGIEIFQPSGQCKPYFLEYDDKHFKEKLTQQLKSYRFLE